MRDRAIVALLVVAVLASAGVGYLVGWNVSESQAAKGTTTTTASSSISTECEVSAEGWVLLQVLNSTTGKPIPSAPVQAEVTPFYCNSSPPAATELNSTLTNSTGFASFGAYLGVYRFALSAYGNYFAYASTLPEQTTCVTLSIPSGLTVIQYSGSFRFGC